MYLHFALPIFCACLFFCQFDSIVSGCTSFVHLQDVFFFLHTLCFLILSCLNHGTKQLFGCYFQPFMSSIQTQSQLKNENINTCFEGKHKNSTYETVYHLGPWLQYSLDSSSGTLYESNPVS